MVQLLLDADDDPDPGLPEAMLGNHTAIVSLLFKSGAKYKVNKRTGKEMLAACKAGHLEVAERIWNAIAFSSLSDVAMGLSAGYDKWMEVACRMGNQAAVYIGEGDSLSGSM